MTTNSVTSSEPEIAAVVCEHVFKDSRDILLVSHDRDGAWQLLCGKMDCGSHTIPRLVGLNHLLERDPSLNGILNLPKGYFSERASIGGLWKRGPLPAGE